MTAVTLDAAGAAELAGMLRFLVGWPRRDPGRLCAWREDFAVILPGPPVGCADGAPGRGVS